MLHFGVPFKTSKQEGNCRVESFVKKALLRANVSSMTISRVNEDEKMCKQTGLVT